MNSNYEKLAARLTSEELLEQVDMFEKDTLLATLLDKLPDIILILNSARQVVYVNKRIFPLIGSEDKLRVYGKRPGEILGCESSYERKGGCGTGDACEYCGALLTIQEALLDLESVNECRIIQKGTGEAFDLRVSGSPIYKNNQRFVIFSLYDISDVKRKEVLERLFFHDILNTAIGISSIAQVLQLQLPPEYDEYKDLIANNSRRLIDEILAQRQLIAAEKGNLAITLSEVNTKLLLYEMRAFCGSFEMAKKIVINISPESESFLIKTDKVIISRVLINLIKNSIEAVYPDGTVTIKALKKDENVVFSVHNDSFMPKEVQSQIFRRSFSTKGTGRGIGTYSIKIFTEQYLKGRVSFTSDEKMGTTFYITLPISS